MEPREQVDAYVSELNFTEYFFTLCDDVSLRLNKELNGLELGGNRLNRTSGDREVLGKKKGGEAEESGHAGGEVEATTHVARCRLVDVGSFKL